MSGVSGLTSSGFAARIQPPNLPNLDSKTQSPSLVLQTYPPSHRHLRHLPAIVTRPTGIGKHDPNNKLLARQTRLRLDAEVVRDAALTASGLFNPKIGGPSVFPPIPTA